MISKRRILIGVMGVVGVSLMLASLFLFVKKEVGGFDFLSSNVSGCTPYNVSVKKGEQEYSVELSWMTKQNCVGYVQYGKDGSKLNSVGVDLIHDVDTKEHTVVLEKLLTTQRYFFVINSDDVTYGTDGIPLEFKISDL